jgi:hypothetical protein
VWGENNSGGGATMHGVLPLTQIPQSGTLEEPPALAMPRRL